MAGLDPAIHALGNINIFAGWPPRGAAMTMRGFHSVRPRESGQATSRQVPSGCRQTLPTMVSGLPSMVTDWENSRHVMS